MAGASATESSKSVESPKIEYKQEKDDRPFECEVHYLASPFAVFMALTDPREYARATRAPAKLERGGKATWPPVAGDEWEMGGGQMCGVYYTVELISDDKKGEDAAGPLNRDAIDSSGGVRFEQAWRSKFWADGKYARLAISCTAVPSKPGECVMRARFEHVPARDKYDNDAFVPTVGAFQQGFLKGIRNIIGYGVSKERVIDDGTGGK